MIAEFLGILNRVLTLGVVVPLLVFLGLYLTYRLRCVQFAKLKMGFVHLCRKNSGGEGDVSHFQAVASVLAGNFGTGNISGMAVALATGGPGALVWMWVMTFLGAAVQFANTLLGAKYRQRNEKGEYVGGPMYYLAHALKWRKAAMLFALMVIVAAVAVGDFVQINSVVMPLAEVGIAPWVAGIIIAALVGVVILGGATRLARVSSTVVPLMALLYLGAAVWILVNYREQLGDALFLIGKSAFGFGPAMAGGLGYTLGRAVACGFDRAIFATDAGTGVVPLLQSGARSTHVVIDGVVTLVAPFLVMIVCTATVLVLMVTGAFSASGLSSTTMVTHAFGQALGNLGVMIVLVALFLFGYTTTLAWASCLDRAVEFLFGDRLVKFFRYGYILLVPVGALLHVDVVWSLADVALTSMLVINGLGVAGLAKEVIRDHRTFFFSKLDQTVE